MGSSLYAVVNLTNSGRYSLSLKLHTEPQLVWVGFWGLARPSPALYSWQVQMCLIACVMVIDLFVSRDVKPRLRPLGLFLNWFAHIGSLNCWATQVIKQYIRPFLKPSARPRLRRGARTEVFKK